MRWTGTVNGLSKRMRPTAVVIKRHIRCSVLFSKHSHPCDSLLPLFPHWPRPCTLVSKMSGALEEVLKANGSIHEVTMTDAALSAMAPAVQQKDTDPDFVISALKEKARVRCWLRAVKTDDYKSQWSASLVEDFT